MINMTHTPPSADDYLSTREVAEQLGVAVRTVQLWVESGVLRAWKTAGGHRRITRESVEALLAARAAAVAEPARGKAPPPFRILVVEDDATLRKLFAMTIESWGLPVEAMTAENGFAALLRLAEVRPDLLISDLNMPGMDGFRMIRHLRDSPQWRELEVIAVTALGEREVQARGELPADVKLLSKPVPFGELERLIRARLAERAAGR